MRPSSLLLLPLLLLTACPAAAPPAVVTLEAAPTATPATAAPTATPPSPSVVPPGMVVIEAAMSHSVSQHPLGGGLRPGAGRERVVSYVRLDGGEVVVYAAERIQCPDKVRLTGRWTSASGDKGGQHVEERQFVADRWECAR